MNQGSSLLIALGLSAAILSGCGAPEQQTVAPETLQPQQVSALGRIEPLDGRRPHWASRVADEPECA